MSRLFASRIVLILLLAVLSAAQSVPSSEYRAIERARLMYYSLQGEGVRELRCIAHPDWEAVLASMKGASANAKARALPYLSHIEFKVVVTASGTSVDFKPTRDEPPADLVNLDTLVELVRFNVQESFDGWRMMTFAPLLPQSNKGYGLEHYGTGYRITLTDPNAGQINLNKEWVIEEITVPLAEKHLTWSIRPHYVKSSGRLLLSSLDEEDARDPSQRLEMTIEYSVVQGIQVPAAFGGKSQHPGGVVEFPVKLDHYQIAKS